MNKSTAHRLAAALVAEGLILQEPASRRYTLGAECYALGLVAAERFGLASLVQEPVRRLAAETGDAAFFSLPHGDHALCLLREEGSYPLKSHVLQAGDRHPLGVGAGSLAILATLDDDELRAALARNEEEIARSFPRFTRPTLLELVDTTRHNGYAINPGLALAGSWGVGIAVCNPDGRAIGAFSIATVETRMSASHEAALVGHLRREADSLAQRLEQQTPANAGG